MKFKKGSRVEVLANTTELCVEWRCARIICRKGHSYRVQYDGSRMTHEAVIVRVPRKAIRPCPPLVKGIERWEANDVIEVYDDGSWTAAIVLKITNGEFYLVRLLISCKELDVHRVNTRVRQSWQNGDWVVKPMVLRKSDNSEVGKCKWNLISNSCKVIPEVQHVSTETSQQGSNDCLPEFDAGGLREPHPASSTTLKRVSPYCSSPAEAYPRKIRVVLNKGDCKRFKAVSTAHLMEKVDAFACPQHDMGEKCLHASLRIEEPDCSDLSSVGSCSVIGNTLNKFSSDMLAGPCQDEDDLSSDAESLHTAGDKGYPISSREVIAERIHRLELHAYRSTLEGQQCRRPAYLVSMANMMIGLFRTKTPHYHSEHLDDLMLHSPVSVHAICYFEYITMSIEKQLIVGCFRFVYLVGSRLSKSRSCVPKDRARHVKVL